MIDSSTYDLSISEPLPESPEPIPNDAPHLLNRLAAEALKNGNPNTRFITPLSANLQTQASQALQYFAQLYRGNGVDNLAAVVISVNDGSVLAYVGNVASTLREHHADVDILSSARSHRQYFEAVFIHNGFARRPNAAK